MAAAPAAYRALGSEARSHSSPPKPNRVLAFLTSGWVRLLVLTWAAYMLTTLSLTWYSVTSYHITGSHIRDDDGAWGKIYDTSRSASKTGITTAAVVSDAVSGKGIHTRLEDEEFELVEDKSKEPKDWHAKLIYTWMVIATTVNSVFALFAWFIIGKNTLVTIFGLDRFGADQETREQRQQIALDVALAWQLLVPFMSMLLERCTGVHDLGISRRLYDRMMTIGPLVMLGQKVLVLLMSTLKDAQKATDSAGDVAWALCSRNVASKTREVKRSAIEIFDKSLVVTRGPMWLQRGCQSAFLAAHFETRPFGVVMGILGLVDAVIVARLTSALLGVIPSWIDNTISQIEGKVNEIGEDASKLNKTMDEHLRTVQHVVDKAAKLLDEATDHLNHARKMVATHSKLIGTEMTVQLEKTIQEVSRPLSEIQKDVNLAATEISKIEGEIKKEATAVLNKVLEKVKALTKLLDSFRPENILARVEHLADEALYGDLITVMQKNKTQGALPLEFERAAPSSA
jgi:hypothetical protein